MLPDPSVADPFPQLSPVWNWTFHGPLTLLQGANAQGKTNLLEAIFFLATSKPVHAQNEREVVDWQAGDEPIPYCRIAAEAHTSTAAAT